LEKGNTWTLKLCYMVLVFLVMLTDSFFIIFCCLSVEEALSHRYLASLHGINEEPGCPIPFNFDFEQGSFTEEHIKELIWRESLNFNPEMMQ